MVWQDILYIIVGGLLGLVLYFLGKKFWPSNKKSVKIFFLLYNVETYFEGLVWDICRISDWQEKEVEIIVSDAGSEDDTADIVKRLAEKGFIKQVERAEAAKFLRGFHGEEIWFFNLNTHSSVKEIRRTLVRIFKEKKSPQEVQKGSTLF